MHVAGMAHASPACRYPAGEPGSPMPLEVLRRAAAVPEAWEESRQHPVKSR